MRCTHCGSPLHAITQCPHRPQLVDKWGTIAVVSTDRVTYQPLAACLANVQRPPGTGVFWQTSSAGRVAKGRNECVRQALAAGASWLWFMDDDHVFAPSTLMRLLRHNVDIVVPLVVSRHPPCEPLVFANFDIHPTMTDAEMVAACVAGRKQSSRRVFWKWGPRERAGC
jgi:hypothetical protein